MNHEQEIRKVIALNEREINQAKEDFENGKLCPDYAAHDIMDAAFLIEHNTKRLDAHLEKKHKQKK